MAVKLRYLDTAKGLTPGELEITNHNYWLIEQALNSVGAATPLVPGSGSPPISDHHLLTNLTTFDDHPQYPYLLGRPGGIRQIGDQTLAGKYVINPHMLVATGSTPDIEFGNATQGVIKIDPPSTHSGGYLFITLDGNLSGIGSSDYLTCTELGVFKIRLSNYETRFYGTVDGSSFGSGITGFDYNLKLMSMSNGTIPLIIRRASGQTANLTEWKNNADTIVLASIDKDGVASFPGLISTGTTSFIDNVLTIIDNVDPSKKLAFQCSSILTGNTRTLTVPDLSGTIALADVNNNILETAIANGSLLARVADNETIIGQWDIGSTGNYLFLHGNGSLGTGIMELLDDGSGWSTIIQFAGVGLTTSRALFIPDADGEIVLTSGTQTLNNKTLATNCIALVNTTGSGFAFADTTSSTKKLRFVLSTANAASHSISLRSAAGTKAHDLPDGHSLTIVGKVGSTTSGNLTDVTATGTGAVGTTSVLASPATGKYRISGYVVITTAGGADRTVNLTLGWHDGTAARTITLAGGPVAGNATNFSDPPLDIFFRATSAGNITYAIAVAGAAGSAPTYAVYIVLEWLGV